MEEITISLTTFYVIGVLIFIVPNWLKKLSYGPLDAYKFSQYHFDVRFIGLKITLYTSNTVKKKSMGYLLQVPISRHEQHLLVPP